MELKYHIKQVKSFNNLRESLNDISQIEPVIVFIDEDDGREYIVDGLKRVRILSELGIDIQKMVFKDFIKLFAYILDSKEVYDATIWKYIHLLKQKNFSEKDIYVYILKERLKISLRDIWKLLEINYSIEIESLLIDLNITIKELISYYEFEMLSFNVLLTLFKTLKANKNNRKELFILINEIMKRENIVFSELLCKKEIKEVLETELQANEKLNLLKKALFILRYPNMSLEIEELSKLKNKIKTPGFRLDLPIDKESVRSNITFQFRNYQELERKVKALTNLLNNDSLKELLEKIDNR